MSSTPADLDDETIDGAHREPVDAPRPAAPPALEDYDALIEVERRHYAITGEIAKGGMGRVLEARDRRLGRPVAIKELLPRNRDAARRFEREARITARLQHPAIIHVYEAGVWPGGEPFYAMTRVSGRSLAQVVAERSTFEERLGLLPHVIAVADALAYAHSQQVIHRDLKPSNVLVGGFGETVVIDWGLAKDLSEEAGDPAMSLELHSSPVETGSGAVVGTPAYMPPEQARGEPLDHRADVYSLGALLYKVLVGSAPYKAKTSDEVLKQVLSGPPTPIDVREPGTPPDLVAIVNKAMSRDLEARYPTAAELAADLKRFQTGQLVAAHHYTRRQLVLRWLERHRVAVAITAIALVVFVVFGTLSVRSIVAEKERAEAEQQIAERRRAALLEERGRIELRAGRAGPALVNLTGAVRGTPSGALAFLLAEAMRPFKARMSTMSAGAGGVVVAFRPSTNEFATASEDGRVVLWDAPTGRAVRELDRGHGGVRALAWSHDGRALAGGGDDGVVRLWTLDGRPPRALASDDGAIGDLELSADGTRLVVGAEARARVWNLATGTSIALAADGVVTAARFSPDGREVLLATATGSAGVWSAETGELEWPLRAVGALAHTDAIGAARWSPSGERVITASVDGTARVWDPTRGKEVAAPIHHNQGAAIDDAAWSIDDRHVITAGRDRVARVWALPEPPVEGEMPAPAREVAQLAHGDRIIQARFSHDGGWIVTASNDRTARVWSVKGEPIATFEHADAVSSVDVSPDGLTLVSGCRDGNASVWDIGRRIANARGHELGSAIHAVAVSPTKVVAAGTDDSRVTLWHADGRAQSLSGHTKRVLALAFSPNGSELATAGEDDHILIWRIGVDAPIRKLAVGAAPVRALAYAPAEDRLAVGDAAGVLRIGPSNGELVERAQLDTPIVALAWAPDKDVIAGATANEVVVWNARGEELTRWSGTAPRALAFDARGERLVVGGVRDTVILRYAGGRLAPVLALERPSGDVNAVAIDREGALVFTGGADGVARVWDAGKGKLLATREHQGEPIEALALSHADEALWTGTTAGNARAWDVRRLRDPSKIVEFLARVPWRLDEDDVVRQVER